MQIRYDAHIHAVLDGVYFKDSIDRHIPSPREDLIREMLQTYQDAGIAFLRDGGDRFGACELAKRIAPEYGIEYIIPVFPIHRKGNYGSFIGRSYEDIGQYRELVAEVKARGGDFIKLMITGLLDFDFFGKLTDYALPYSEVKEMVSIAHGEGFSVMAHCNSSEAIINAARAGIDSIEHGYYTDKAAREAMAEHDTIWVPTFAPLHSPIGKGRFDDDILTRITESQLEAVSDFASLGGKLCTGSDAGAFAVPHGMGTADEETLMEKALGESFQLKTQEGLSALKEKFKFGR